MSQPVSESCPQLSSPTVPLTNDGYLDLAAVQPCDKEHRQFLATQMTEVCRKYGIFVTRTKIIPLITAAAKFDDVAVLLAQALPELFSLCRTESLADASLSFMSPSSGIQRQHGTVNFETSEEEETNREAMSLPVIDLLMPLLRVLLWHVEPKVCHETAASLCALMSGGMNPGTECDDDEVPRIRSQLPTQTLTSDKERDALRRLALQLAKDPWAAAASSATGMLAEVCRAAAYEITLLFQGNGDDSRERLTQALEVRTDAKTFFKRLCAHKSIRVRRAAAHHLDQWIVPSVLDLPSEAQPVSGKPSEGLTFLQEELTTFAGPLVKAFAQDPFHDSLRFSAVLPLAKLARYLPLQSKVDFVLPLFISLCQDESWRVRWTAARQFVLFSRQFSDAEAALVPSLVLLSEDEEPEVRAAVGSNLGNLAALLQPPVVTANLLPVVQRLSGDAAPVVRRAVAGSICSVCRRCERRDDAQELIALVLHMMAASTAQPPRETEPLAEGKICAANPPQSAESKKAQGEEESVYMQLVQSVVDLQHLLESEEIATKFVQAFVHLSQSPAWRLRAAVAQELRQFVRYVPHDVLCSTSYAAAKLMSELVLTFIIDPVAAVRTAMISTLPHMAERFGVVWVEDAVSRWGVALGASKKYSDRQLYIRCLAAVLPPFSFFPRSSGFNGNDPHGQHAPHPTFILRVNSDIVDLAKDRIPNVRVTLARSISTGPLSQCNLVQPGVSEARDILRVDQDPDVVAECEKSVATQDAPF